MNISQDEELTQAITAASNSSAFLSKVLICTIIIGTLIVALQWYSTHRYDYDFTHYSEQKLACTIELADDQNETMTDAVIEMCSRKFP